ncbi:MAG TPA: transglycosylase SLT domain-containing protein [Longimicrobiales bacterium]
MLEFRRKEDASLDASCGMMEELERLWRRVRALAHVAPVLLVVGFSAGEIANRVLSVPEDKAVRLGEKVPQTDLEQWAGRMQRIRGEGQKTVSYVSLYRDHVEPVEKVLRRHGIAGTTARKISWPLVEESYRRNLDPATVISIMLIESEGKPTARSFVGAAGLMQVMPFWAGRWRGCGKDLYDIETNLCNGTSILAWYFRNFDGERKALLGYNGCVRGTNTPRCHTYPDKVAKLRDRIRVELAAARPPRPEESTD